MRVTPLDDTTVAWESLAAEGAVHYISTGICHPSELMLIAMEEEQKFAMVYPSDGDIVFLRE